MSIRIPAVFAIAALSVACGAADPAPAVEAKAEKPTGAAKPADKPTSRPKTKYIVNELYLGMPLSEVRKHYADLKVTQFLPPLVGLRVDVRSKVGDWDRVWLLASLPEAGEQVYHIGCRKVFPYPPNWHILEDKLIKRYGEPAGSNERAGTKRDKIQIIWGKTKQLKSGEATLQGTGLVVELSTKRELVDGIDGYEMFFSFWDAVIYEKNRRGDSAIMKTTTREFEF